MPGVINLREAAVKQTWAAEMIRNEKELLNIADRITAIAANIAALKAKVQAEPLATADDLTFVTNAETFINNAKVTDFVTFINANLPVVSG